MNPKTKRKLFIKELYNDFLKYGTIYGGNAISGIHMNPRKEYYVRTNENGNIFDIPVVVDGTEYNPFDYRIGFGIRKLQDSTMKENLVIFGQVLIEKDKLRIILPTSMVQGFEYLLHWEKERNRGDVWTNSRYFLRHTGKYHIAKIETRKQVGYLISNINQRK